MKRPMETGLEDAPPVTSFDDYCQTTYSKGLDRKNLEQGKICQCPE